MSAGSPARAGVAPSSWGALDRITRYLYGALGPQRGPGGAGLARPRALLRELGDPQDGFRAVHVAGTAGKGSVSTLVASVLPAHGRVGAHLSPHAHCLLERSSSTAGPPRRSSSRRRWPGYGLRSPHWRRSCRASWRDVRPTRWPVPRRDRGGTPGRGQRLIPPARRRAPGDLGAVMLPSTSPAALGAPTASAPGPPSGARPRTGCWSRSDRRRSSTSWLR